MGQNQSQPAARAARGSVTGSNNGADSGDGEQPIPAPAKTLHADAVNAISFGESPWTIITGGQDKTVAVYVSLDSLGFGLKGSLPSLCTVVWSTT